MKTFGIIVILCSGILVLLLLLIPIGVQMQLNAYPDQHYTVNGQLRVAQLVVTNTGIFSQRITLPELTACAGATEIPLDSWLLSGGAVTPGFGQQRSISLRAGESGTVYYVARESTFYETLKVYRREPYFSCLNPGIPLN